MWTVAERMHLRYSEAVDPATAGLAVLDLPKIADYAAVYLTTAAPERLLI